jgi:hypothetical protein
MSRRHVHVFVSTAFRLNIFVSLPQLELRSAPCSRLNFSIIIQRSHPGRCCHHCHPSRLCTHPSFFHCFLPVHHRFLPCTSPLPPFLYRGSAARYPFRSIQGPRSRLNGIVGLRKKYMLPNCVCLQTVQSASHCPVSSCWFFFSGEL